MTTKEGVVRPGVTPDTEKRIPPGEKAASGTVLQRQITELDDDMTKQLADAAERGLRR